MGLHHHSFQKIIYQRVHETKDYSSMSNIDSDNIIEFFHNFILSNNREPTFLEMEKANIHRRDIRRCFGNKTRLKEIVIEKYNLTLIEEPVETVEATDFNEEKRKFIKELYLKILDANKAFPVYGDFVDYGVSSSNISTLFGGIEKLKNIIMEENGDFISQRFSTLKSLFDGSRNVNSENSVGKRFIVTTAVGDCKANMSFLKAIDTYCEHMNAKIVIMPCESTTNSFENETALFDPIFNDPKYLFVTRDEKLNENLKLCSIQVSANQIKATTGLSRLGTSGSYIFASPKQFLDYKPSGHTKGKNYSIMTTGACTEKSYFNNKFVSKRLSYIADHDHTIGAIIVEIVDDKQFHFRQVQADENGNFIDLGVEYRSDGTVVTDIPMNIVFGDIHAINIDCDAFDSFLHDFKNFHIKEVFLHDLFDGNSVNHHISTIEEKTKRYYLGKESLNHELISTYGILEDINSELAPEKIFVVKSNHDEFLTRYLSEGRYVSDPTNHYLSLKIATALFEEKDVLQHAFEVVSQYNSFPMYLDNVCFLNRNHSYKISGIQMAAHGDKGVNGAKPSLNGLEEVYGDCVVAHNHTPAIQRGVFRVGTMSKLDQGYNVGPNSWAHTNCIVYDNGQRQLVNFVNNTYFM